MSPQKTRGEFPNLYIWWETIARRSESSHAGPKVSHCQEVVDEKGTFDLNPWLLEKTKEHREVR
jgi:hypothetical protein